LYPRHTRQHSAHFIQNVSRQHHIQPTLPPDINDMPRNAPRISQSRNQNVGVQHNTQTRHQRARSRATAASISASPSSTGTSA
jgi:hypothetical protein